MADEARGSKGAAEPKAPGKLRWLIGWVLVPVGFEVVSAFATVGVSAGVTPLLTEVGKLIIIALMFIGRLGPLTPVAVALALAVSFLGSCTDHEPEDAVEAVGSETITIRTADGLTLDGRVWDRGHDRLVIYLHEFRENQDSWWPYAREPRGEGVSALTFDFRGHGKSEGNLDDIDGMVLDAEAAIAFARDRGFERVMLVGAGMGAGANAGPNFNVALQFIRQNCYQCHGEQRPRGDVQLRARAPLERRTPRGPRRADPG